MQKAKYFFLLLFFLPVLLFAQRIDNTAAFRNVSGGKYFRLHYDNDFWGKTDYYYTQGYQFEIVNSVFSKSPASKLLIRFKKSMVKYGLSFEHYGFTPTSIKSNEILNGDRPFAGVIMLKSFSISVDSIKKQRLTTTLSTGMIGPAAFAGKMQATIHRWTGDQNPQGWQNQIRNDVIINYELTHEKQLLYLPNIVSIHTKVLARIGTLSDKAQTGFTFTLGRFHSPFSVPKDENLSDFQIYAYSQPLVNFIGYDASMQGGIFDRNSPYVLKSDEINRITFQNNFGIVASFWKLHAEYYRTFLTKEFKSGKQHLWGGVKIGILF